MIIYNKKEDDIPELVVNVSSSVTHAAGYCALYTYKNGKVIKICTLADDFSYYPRKNLISSMYWGTGVKTYFYYTVSGMKTKRILVRDKVLSISGIKGKITYWKCISEKKDKYKEITKKQFDKLLKKRVGKTKMKSAKFVNNNASNRKSKLGY